MRTFSIQDGLPAAEVFHIMQDRAGFLWFSTSNGVAVFDGYEMKAFSVADGVPDPLILETREDKSGRVWMRSYSGRIAYHQNGVIHPFIFNDTLSKFCQKGFLEALGEDPEGNWIYYESGDRFGAIHKNGEMRWRQLRPGRIAITEFGSHLVIQNSMHESGGTGVVQIDSKEFEINIPFQDAKYGHHRYNAVRWGKKIYFSVRNNLYCYDGQAIKRVFIAGAPIINLSTDRQGHLYVGHMNYGALRFHDEAFEMGDSLGFTRNHSVTSVLEDHEGGLWVSTLDAGVLYSPSTGIEHFYLPGNSSTKAIMMDDDRVLIGAYDGQLLSLDVKTMKVQEKAKFDRTILALHAHNDTIFVGTSTHLYILKGLQGKPITSYVGSTQGFIKKDSEILALTAGSITAHTGNGRRISKMNYPAKIRDIYIDKNQSYVLTHMGLVVCDKNLVIVNKPKTLEQFRISQVMPINDSMVVIGTLGSGLLVTDKAFSQVKRFESLPRDIYSIAKLNGQFFFASEQGIFSVLPADLIGGTDRSFGSVMLSVRNGLLEKPIVALKVTAFGRLLVIYDRALSVIDPQALQNLNKSPRFYLEQVSLNNHYILTRSHYNLPYDSNTVQFDFGFVSFNNQDINIRYRLRNDASWIYPRRTNSISLYSLPPGTYKPQLEYSVDRFAWQRADAIPSLSIGYPWWKNPYVQGTVGIIMVGITFMIARNRIDIQRERNKRLREQTVQQQLLLHTEKQTTDRERNRIAKDLHDSVGSSLLATKLSIGRILRRYNHHEADEIDHQLNNTLNEIKGIIYDLTPTELERDGLEVSVRNYIDKLSGLTDMELRVVFYGEDVLDRRISIPVFRILQELLSNSIKHSTGNSISVHINSFNTLLSLVYEDSGQGFSPEKSRGGGLGLTNIENRVKSLKGELKFDSGTYGTSYIIEIPKPLQNDTQ